ncbi:MAG: hypothetical protein LBB22_05955 [Treponema sp.]|nr:hypothetical protein [Treponema sp.]
MRNSLYIFLGVSVFAAGAFFACQLKPDAVEEETVNEKVNRFLDALGSESASFKINNDGFLAFTIPDVTNYSYESDSGELMYFVKDARLTNGPALSKNNNSFTLKKANGYTSLYIDPQAILSAGGGSSTILFQNITLDVVGSSSLISAVSGSHRTITLSLIPVGGTMNALRVAAGSLSNRADTASGGSIMNNYDAGIVDLTAGSAGTLIYGTSQAGSIQTNLTGASHPPITFPANIKASTVSMVSAEFAGFNSSFTAGFFTLDNSDGLLWITDTGSASSNGDIAGTVTVIFGENPVIEIFSGSLRNKIQPFGVGLIVNR